jgi:hypothetical protein
MYIQFSLKVAQISKKYTIKPKLNSIRSALFNAGLVGNLAEIGNMVQ